MSYILSGINWAIVGLPVASYEPQMSIHTAMAEAIHRALLGSIGSGIWGLLTLIGSIAIVVRRLHDTNRRGWWYFLGFIPFVGSIILIVFFVQPPDPAGARFDRSRPS